MSKSFGGVTPVMCAQTVKREAKICRFCGHKFLMPVDAP